MSKSLIGEPLLRREDERLLRGEGRYIDDIKLPGMLHVAFHRSPYAHAKIISIDTSRCREVEGVIEVICSDDLGHAGGSFPQILPHKGLTSRTWRALAQDKVRFVGEPVVAVVARTLDIAKDAIEELDIEYEPLPVVINAEEALLPGSPLVHDDAPNNVAVHISQRYGEPEEAIRNAQHRIAERLSVRRGSGQPMEPRGVVAKFDQQTQELTVWTSTQEPHTVRNAITSLLELSVHEIRVITPDTGGGFGTKLNAYPEEVLLPWIAQHLQRPVKWIESRSEHMLSATQERDQLHDIEVAFDEQGLILALKDVFIHDSGAYTPRGGAAPLITSAALPGPYKIPHYHSEFRAVYTNTATVSIYRGAGQPQATFIMERIMDRIASFLNLDPADVRMRNSIRVEDFPYDTKLKSFLGTPAIYDSGDFRGMLQKALDAANYTEMRAFQKQKRAEGKLVGVGIGSYVELTGRGPWEGATVRIERTGKVTVITGAPTQGQGHHTTFTQICAQELCVPIEQVDFRSGDTSAIPFGIGTFASRAGVLVGNAVKQASNAVGAKLLKAASFLLQMPVSELKLEDGYVGVLHTPDTRLSFAEIASRAAQYIAPDETEPGFMSTHYFQAPQMAYANGSHVALVEVDASTGQVEILKYVIGHDCGKAINPLIVDGQIHGGFACGLGNALLEQHVYDESGQLLTGSFMDYTMPRALDVPPITIVHQETLATINPLGMKGTGEAGTIPVAAAISAAVEDALRPLGVKIKHAPILQQDLWLSIEQAKSAQSKETGENKPALLETL